MKRETAGNEGKRRSATAADDTSAVVGFDQIRN